MLDDESFVFEFCSFVCRLAVKCNWHLHNKTCYKHLQKGERCSDGNCRMHINGQTRAFTELDEETLSILLHCLHPWINNFNNIVLFLLQSNMDIKYVGSGPAAKALAYYITDYIMKSDLKIHTGIHTLQAAMQSHAIKFKDDTVSTYAFHDRNLVMKCVNSFIGRQEVSHQQVMSYFVGGGNYYTSHDFRLFRFFTFLHSLWNWEASRTNAEPEGDLEEDLDATGGDSDHNVTLGISSGKPVISSDIMDYQFRPHEEPFGSLTLWEFIERMQKVRCCSLVCHRKCWCAASTGT